MPKKKLLNLKEALDTASKTGAEINVEFDAGGKVTGIILIPKVKKKEDKTCIPEAGHIKYFILCERLSIYTSIGADNVHHASNKATKLFGPMWSQLATDAYLLRGYNYVVVKDFSLLVRSLAN